MRDDLPLDMERIWRSGDYTGRNRPVTRITIQRPQMQISTHEMMSTFRRVPALGSDITSFNPYPTGLDPDSGESVTTAYADYLFHPAGPPLEFPNVRTVSFARSTDIDVAEVNISMWNTRPLGVGEKPHRGDFDSPGFYSFGRGTSKFSSRWGHLPNVYAQMLVPDNIVRVYQGYGSDLLHDLNLTAETCPPERDSRLTLTGTWHIDDVGFDSRGNLTIKGRDMARLLLDHQAFVPVIPEDFYPPTFEGWGTDVTTQQQYNYIVDTTSRGPIPFTLSGSANDPWPETAYLGAGRHGHQLAHAADGDPGTYWLSVGNPKPTYRSAYEYIDLSVANMTVEEIHFWTVKGGYTGYVSVQQGGQWMPGPAMPYHRDGRGKYEEGVPYIAFASLGPGEGEHVIPLGTIPNVTLVRLWLGNTQNFGLPGSKYRAGIREVSLRGVTGGLEQRSGINVQQRKLTPGPAGSNPGRVQDLTDIVKLMCAWGGLYWSGDAVSVHTDGRVVPVGPQDPDNETLGAGVTGRVWGDFQQSGTAPLVQILAGAFDKKSLLDGIRYVAEMIGFIFMVDETGAAQWRQPNIWDSGNWIAGMSTRPGRTKNMLTLDERQVVEGLEATISSRNVREQIFVGNFVGKQGALVGGYNPNDTGLRRFAGWTDSNFATVAESQVMADLIAVRQLFKYRTDTPTIPAFPGLQVDDQVRIFERVTSEGFIHYVKGVSSDFNAETGEWKYTLQTHWLGDDPEGAWVLNKSSLNSNTIAYVDSLSQGSQWSRAGMEL